MTMRCIAMLIAVGMILLTAVAMMAPVQSSVRPQPAHSAMTTVILVRHCREEIRTGRIPIPI